MNFFETKYFYISGDSDSITEIKKISITRGIKKSILITKLLENGFKKLEDVDLFCEFCKLNQNFEVKKINTEIPIALAEAIKFYAKKKGVHLWFLQTLCLKKGLEMFD